MKQIMKTVLFCTCLFPAIGIAQEVDVNRDLYPDYSTDIDPDYGLLAPKSLLGVAAAEPLPDHVDNSKLKFFPPVFNQSGGSCGSASRICYMFTYEINAYRNVNGKLLENRYPSHFTWLLTNGNSGKHLIVEKIGCPNAVVYGGTTYSSLFGPQDMATTDYGWMQGYDKWYSAMWNRMEAPTKFPLHVGTPEGREAVKRWLYNHNGDPDFYGGGVVGIGVATKTMVNKVIGKTPTNDEIGVSGMKYVDKWGPQVDHALTIVGYDDRIEFDLDKNGKFGEKDKDEVGAWIIVNSWGKWANNGFIYCPYKYSVPAMKEEGVVPDNYWTPEIYKVRKNYRPLRTIKVKMDYSRRSEICLGAGISTNLNDTLPQQSIQFEHFKYAGDGKKGSLNPAPEVPMLGRWADGKLHDEPMEFGYDLTDLSSQYDKSMPLKYFFIVECKDWAEGTGKIYNTSIIDYESDPKGVETPFDLSAEGVQIQNQGKRTIISTIVYGDSHFAPLNLSLVGKKLIWNAPLRSPYTVKGYKVFCNGVTLAEMGADKLAYELADEADIATYSVSAVYEDGSESAKVSVSTPIRTVVINQATNFKHSGFSIPNVFQTKYKEATLEFWIKPSSLANWNQQGGPGWGKFMFHAGANGSFTAGWATGSDRVTTSPGKLIINHWTHVAMTVKDNVFTVYINGMKSGSVTSKIYSGLGGFGDLVFAAQPDKNNIDGCIDEIRVWNYAREQRDLLLNKNVEYTGSLLPEGLVAYYKGDVIEHDDVHYLREYVNGNHAEILKSQFAQVNSNDLKLNAPKDKMALDIVKPQGTIFAGMPTTFTATYSSAVNQLVWSAEGAGVKDLQVSSPKFVFEKAGEQVVDVMGYSANGESLKASCQVNVEASPAPDATFVASQHEISAGERVTFLVQQPVLGYFYEWSMPGGDTESSQGVNCATTYPKQGQYEVSLTVTSPDGQKANSKQTFEVVEVAPKADFEVSPAVVVLGETVFLKDQSKYQPNQWQWLIDGSQKDVVINGQNSSFTPEYPGIYNITLTAKNGTGSNSITRSHALVVCNADSKNGLNFTGEDDKVTLSKVPFVNNAHVVTVEWWMNPASLSATSCGWGEKGSVQFFVASDGSATVSVRNKKVTTKADFVRTNEWHHYAVTIFNGTVRFYRDGQEFSGGTAGVAILPAMKTFTIGGNSAPMLGFIDEFRVWNSVLKAGELQTYLNAPITDIAKAVAEDKLAVYYDFNQNSGDVEDRSGHDNVGIRTNFGPDGDAWGLSKGVFSLSFDEAALAKDVTAKYLKNYKQAFQRDGNKLVNPAQAPRFGAIKDWILENADVSGQITTSVHVDRQKESCFTFTAGWDGFTALVNHKAYQTFTLPAGSYTFTAKYGNVEGACGNSYLVVNAGKGLPNTAEVSSAIAYEKMRNGDKTNKKNELHFVLPEETEVSLGLLINLDGKRCCTLGEFNLTASEVDVREADNADGYDLAVDASGYTTLYLPYPTILPEGVTAYVAKEVKGDEVLLEAIESSVVPAHTGVVIRAEAGNYHFTPSESNSDQTSLLVGVAKDTEVSADQRYYSFNADQPSSFQLYQSSTLQANRAYLVRPASDTVEKYKVTFVQTGIDHIFGDKVPTLYYDISGRRVNVPVKGLYITNGKKILVK